MNEVMLGGGYASGMFYTAPKGTAIPAPGESLSAWTEVGDVDEDGISFTPRDSSTLKNWAGQPKRVIPGTDPGTIKANHRVGKFPHAVKRLRERHVAFAAALLAVIIQVITVGVDLADAEYARVVEPLDIGLHTCYLPLIMRAKIPIRKYYTLYTRRV